MASANQIYEKLSIVENQFPPTRATVRNIVSHIKEKLYPKMDFKTIHDISFSSESN